LHTLLRFLADVGVIAKSLGDGDGRKIQIPGNIYQANTHFSTVLRTANIFSQVSHLSLACEHLCSVSAWARHAADCTGHADLSPGQIYVFAKVGANGQSTLFIECSLHLLKRLQFS
jgi:hypothetical protein